MAASRVELLKAEALRGMRTVDLHVPAATMLQIGQRLALQAACFDRSNDVDRAFILYYRVAKLLTVELPRHAEFPEVQPAARAAAEQCVAALERLRKALDAAATPPLHLARAVSLPTTAGMSAASTEVPRAAGAAPPSSPAAGVATLQAAPVAAAAAVVGMQAADAPLLPRVEQPPVEVETTLHAHAHPTVTAETPSSRQVVYPALCRLEDAAAPPTAGLPLSTGASSTAGDAPVCYPLLDLSRRAPDSDGGGGQPRLHMMVTLPRAAVEAFLAAAAGNTNRHPRGVETCALLAGRDGVITTVILPPQKGEADMCEMTDEVAALTTCLARSVHVLGWIHTHPSQSCFLSSMDLHTHAGFQSSLPSAIAVVCAPSDAMQSIGVFRLTDDTDVERAGGFMRSGLDIIQTCTRSGFHPHNTTPGVDMPLYLPAAHVVFDPHAQVELLDMR